MLQLPDDFISRMRLTLGDETLDFIDSICSIPPVSIHLHPTKKISIDKAILGEQVAWNPNGFYLNERPSFTADPCFHGGAYYVQEASSMTIVEALNSLPTKDLSSCKILDLCAAPGGKSTLLLSYLNGQGLLVSNETISSRVAPLAHNLTKWGYSNKVISHSDSSRFSSLQEYFDIILVDAPCSGEGLFRKDNDSINHWNDHNLLECSLRQQRLLQDILPALKSNGYLIYSTCTYNPKENIDIIQRICQNGFECIPIESLPTFGFSQLEKDNCIGYQAYPHKIKGEGFFISLMKKGYVSRPNNYLQSKIIQKTNSPELKKWMELSGLETFIHQDHYYAVPQIKDIEIIASYLKIIQAGTKLGRFNGKIFVPDHDLSQSLHVESSIPRVELSLEESLHYLKRNSLNTSSCQMGYCLASYKGLVLGWIKGITGRFNNLLPMEYRIKSQYIK